MTGKDGESSENKVNPFFESTVSCPICGMSSAHPRLKSNLFVEKEKDVDLRPIKIFFPIKGVEHIHPPLYYAWYCPQCFFAAGHAFYEDPSKNTSLSGARLKQLITSTRSTNDKAKQVIALLTKDLTPQQKERSFYQGMKVLLLSIYNLEMQEQIAKACVMNNGRYYLRTAWLYRDMSDDQRWAQSLPQIRELTRKLKEFWPKVPEDERSAFTLLRHRISSMPSKTPMRFKHRWIKSNYLCLLPGFI